LIADQDCETDQIADLTRKLTTVAPAQEERTESGVRQRCGRARADLTIRYQCGRRHGRRSTMRGYRQATEIKRPLQLIRRASIQQRTGEKGTTSS
jgi:hypothetical protein